MNKRRNNTRLALVCLLLGLAAGNWSARAAGAEKAPVLTRGAKVVSKHSSLRAPADPPPQLPAGASNPDFGSWGAGAWAGPPGRFGGHEIASPRSRVRQARFQEDEEMSTPALDPRDDPTLDPAIDPDIGNLPVPGAEEGGPVTPKARRYLEHSLMYDDAAQAEARRKTITNFHPGYPTNNNNEFGDYAFGPPIDGPLLDKAGHYGYGPDHDSCYGSGRCGRDALCCGRHGGCKECGGGMCRPTGCGGCGAEGCGSCGGYQARWWENLTASGGFQGFKSPIDLGRNGNFGLREGVNWGVPLSRTRRIGGQLGVNALQSDLSGNNVVGPTSSARSQLFVTAGLFHRVLPGERWQGGVAYDYLHDDYYITNDLHKIRGELSFVASNHEEIGAWVSVGLNDTGFFDSIFGSTGTGWTSNDLYAAFWRRTFENGSNLRAWAGASGSGDGMLGGELRIPFSDSLALEGNVNYLIPKHGITANGAGGAEAWNVAIGIAWYPGRNAYCASFSPWRPLFAVADNALFPYRQK